MSVGSSIDNGGGRFEHHSDLTIDLAEFVLVKLEGVLINSKLLRIFISTQANCKKNLN